MYYDNEPIDLSPEDKHLEMIRLDLESRGFEGVRDLDGRDIVAVAPDRRKPEELVFLMRISFRDNKNITYVGYQPVLQEGSGEE